jgi:ankyrin repeat protein
MSDHTAKGESSLRKAIRDGDLASCNALIAQGSECSGDLDVADWTLLHLASSVGRLDIVALLLNHGAGDEVNHRAVDGNTACHLAASCGYGQVVGELIRQGANLSIVNHKGKNVLQEAERNEHEDLLKQLQVQHVSSGRRK